MHMPGGIWVSGLLRASSRVWIGTTITATVATTTAVAASTSTTTTIRPSHRLISQFDRTTRLSSSAFSSTRKMSLKTIAVLDEGELGDGEMYV